MQPTVSTNKRIHLRNNVLSIYPDPSTLTAPMEPAGHPFIRDSTIRFRGKTNSGGHKMPAAFMQHKAVIFLPRSALDTFRTWFMRVVQITLDGFNAVVKPVSSQFHILVETNLPSVSKTLLNPSIRAKLVAVGRLMVRVLCLPRNALAQSRPARPLVNVNSDGKIECQTSKIYHCQAVRGRFHFFYMFHKFFLELQ